MTTQTQQRRRGGRGEDMTDKPDVESDAELIARVRQDLLDPTMQRTANGYWRQDIIPELCNRLESATQRGRLSEGDENLLHDVMLIAGEVSETGWRSAADTIASVVALVRRLAGEEVRRG